MCNVINYTEYISSETMQQDVNSFLQEEMTKFLRSILQQKKKTSMHSSRMRNVRLLPV